MVTDKFDREIEAYIRESFEENLAWLQAETGAGLAPDISRISRCSRSSFTGVN